MNPRPFRSPHPLARLLPAAAVVVMVCAALVWIAVDARVRVRERERGNAVRMAAALAIGPELALHSASRWLRHPTRSEPWAASADAPAVLDVDPAGALAPPPTEALRAGWAPATLQHRSRR